MIAVLEWTMAHTSNTARSPTRMLPKEFMITQLSVVFDWMLTSDYKWFTFGNWHIPAAVKNTSYMGTQFR